MCDGVTRARVDEVGRAELLGRLPLHLHGIDCDDARRACDARSLDDGLTHTTASDDGDRRARLHIGGVQRRADARRDTTADQRELFVRQVAVDLDDRPFAARHLLGERAEARHRHVVGAVGTLPAHRHHDAQLVVAQV